MYDTWIHFGALLLALATAAGTVVRMIGKKVDDRFDKVDLQFAKVDLKFDTVFDQIDRLKETGNARHITNVERMARMEGQIAALPQRVNIPNGSPPKTSVS